MDLQSIELRVHGMHCAGCVSSVERALTNVEGVRSASVNLTAEAARVHAAADANVDALIAAVRSAGFDASVAERDAEPEALAAEQAEAWRRRRRDLVIGAVCAAVVVLGHVVVRSAEAPFGWPLAVYGSISGGLTLAAAWFAGRSMLLGGWRALVGLRANMDLLVTLGAGAAFVSGVLGIVLDIPRMVVFEAAAMIIVFVAVGKYLEARARGRSTDALRQLVQRIPREARKVMNGSAVTVPVEAVAVGDVVRLAAQEAVPIDG